MNDKHTNKILLLTILGVIFALSAINNSTPYNDYDTIDNKVEFRSETIIKRPNVSWYNNSENPIHIDGSATGAGAHNWTWARDTQEWCQKGDGSWSNPYVIENITIDGGGSGSGIYIEYSNNVYFIIRNCTVFNSGINEYDAGIKLDNTSNGTLINNNFSTNGGNGICFYIFCYNNTIISNTLNNNAKMGIFLITSCDNNTISNNTVNDNGVNGIHLKYTCLNNNITGNIASNTEGSGAQDVGIYLYINCDDNIVANNTVNYNTLNGIYVRTGSHFNTIEGNTANNNTRSGIDLYNGCDNNTIANNTVNDNTRYGIGLKTACDDNTIANNTANDNEDSGIHLELNCDNNTISGNIASNTGGSGAQIAGIYIYNNCDRNTIVNNTANDNTQTGIYFNDECYNNTISGNNASDNYFGIAVDFECDNNNFTKNVLYNNTMGILIELSSDNNSLYENFFLENGNHALDNGTDNKWNSITIGNYWDNHTGPDTTPQDGIVDTPYSYIIGSAGSIDYLPIAAVQITINSPNDDDVFGINAPTYEVTITDNYLDSMWYTLDGGLNNYTFTDNGTINPTAWVALLDGPVTITFYANDTLGHIGTAGVNIVKDTQLPIITINSPMHDDPFGTSAPTFNVRITDDNLDTMWYTLDGGLNNYTFTDNGTINPTAWAELPEGNVTITIHARDLAGNEASESVTVIKSIPAGGPDTVLLIIIVTISIVGGVAVISVLYIFKKKRITTE